MILFALAMASAIVAGADVADSDAANSDVAGVDITSEGAGSGQRLAADPTSLVRVIAAAKPGDTIKLVAGYYPWFRIKSRTFSPALTIDASAARLGGVMIWYSTGIRWTGGTFPGNPTTKEDYGFVARESKAISVRSVHISNLHAGIVYDRVTGGTISGNWLTKMTSDGIDLALSRNIVVSHNACSDFAPVSWAHPDCIQLWSRPEVPPTADVTITGNSVVGTTQGISLFNHVRDGVNDGGFDRITITSNTVLNTLADGIYVVSCRNCTVKKNTVNSLPNYINKAQLFIYGGSVTQCGNVVPMVPRQGTPPCKN